jgi:predicted 2-oxoglutarate/Fe(II)-dependent dioxygenase YbiX
VKKYIKEIRKVIPSKVCQKIIKYFGNAFDDAATVGGVDKNVRNCVTTTLLQPKSFGQRIVSNYVQSIFYQIADSYSKEHRSFQFQRISQLDLLKYETNQYKVGYDFHEDFGNKATERHISISLNLNDAFEGGEFVFSLSDNSLEQYIQGTGDAIVFPSNFIFPHRVNKITKGTRYALIGWVI